MRFQQGQVLFKQGEPASHFYIVKSGTLQIAFVSTGEEAELGRLQPGDQFGYDAVLGEFHDTTVRCKTEAEVVAVPREQLQKAFTQDSYLQSVWQAPAQRSIRLRRQLSQATHSPADAGSVKSQASSSQQASQQQQQAASLGGGDDADHHHRGGGDASLRVGARRRAAARRRLWPAAAARGSAA